MPLKMPPQKQVGMSRQQPAQPPASSAMSKQQPAQSPASSAMNPEYDHLFNIKLLGDSGAGKTCLLLRFAEDTYTENYLSTIGVDFKTKAIEAAGKKIRLNILDTAGQERFRTITSQYEQNPHAVMICFDLTDKESFNNAKIWYTQTKEKEKKGTIIFLVGNKSDKTTQRVVDDVELQKLAEENPDINLAITSAKENSYVSETFAAVAESILYKLWHDLEGKPNSEHPNAKLIAEITAKIAEFEKENPFFEAGKNRKKLSIEALTNLIELLDTNFQESPEEHVADIKTAYQDAEINISVGPAFKSENCLIQ